MSDEIRTFDERAYNDLIDMVRYWRANGRWSGSQSVIAPLGSSDAILFRNDSGEGIPPYACMYVTGTEELNGQNYLIVDKPDADSFYGDPSRWLFNGPHAVEDGDKETGTAQSGPILHAFKDSSDTDDPDAGTHWIPVSGQWYLERSDGAIWTAMGEDDVADDVFRVRVNPVENWSGKIGTPITAGSTGSMTVYRDGSATATTFAGIKNNWSASAPADTSKRVKVFRDPLTGKLCDPFEDC